MDDREVLTRRRVLAGLGAAAGTAAVAGCNDSGSTAADRTPVAAFDVRSFGARGDGSADDREAIQAALDAVGDRGGEVFLPPGTYLVGGPVRPRSGTLLRGTHAPRYTAEPDAPSSCRLVPAEGFPEDGGLIENDEGEPARGVSVKNVALVGRREGESVCGLRFPDDYTGEHLWALDEVSIISFTGDGIRGRYNVCSLHRCYVMGNDGWGLNAGDGGWWRDGFVDTCIFAYNRAGNLVFAGSEASGAVVFANTRIERAGNRFQEPEAPLNPAAPGIRLASARFFNFVNCTTDANTGSGVEIVREEGGPDGCPMFVGFANCAFRRDGTGDGETLGDFAGVRVIGTQEGSPPQRITFTGCTVTAGASSDFAGGLIGPRYGLWYANVEHLQWLGGTLLPAQTALRAEGDNFRPVIHEPGSNLMTVPSGAPSDVGALPDGALYADPSEERLFVRLEGRWRSVRLD